MLNRILLALVFCALFVSGAAAAQGERAQLTVLIGDTLNQPVVGARVAISGVTVTGITDSTGIAVIPGVPLGSRLVIMQHPGFAREEALVEFPTAANYGLRVRMTPAAIVLDTVTATAKRFNLALHQNGFYERQRQGLGRYMTSEELDEINRSSQDLSRAFDRMPGFRVDRGTVGVPFVLRSVRGGGGLEGNCVPGVRVDGMPADMELLATLSPSQVEAIEVYPSPASVPAEYNDAGSHCGMVIIWTRR
ncbi:MAG TPA: TonB-dependent receptor [Longimicrobium sp.]|jgi:hypothetical protein|uniref:TonB-dependent receptor n=1 Tax=Longimicrobium sp. TaxID=2029185 RepID=UPI002EDA45FD